MLRRSNKIEISGFSYKIIRRKNLTVDGERACGCIDIEDHKIYVDYKLTGKELVDTLIHESIHAVGNAIGIKIEEENVIRATTFIRGLLKDNKKMILWMLNVLDK